MMAQYLEIKNAHPGDLLFYRMGDFYEMFFEDAEQAAAALDITLTKRGKHQGADIPMCGVPVHAAESYLSRLIRKGFRVAVCEQTEDPAEAKKRGSKSVVRRDVVRVVTPGTITEDALLDARRHNYLAAVADAGGSLGLAWLDVSTGAFFAQPVESAGLGAALARIEPGELLVPERLTSRPEFFDVFADFRDAIAPLPDGRFDSETARRRLLDIYEVKALDAFGDYDRAEVSAAGAVIGYVEATQKGKLPRLQRPRRLAGGERRLGQTGRTASRLGYGAMELAPSMGLCRRIVDLVETGSYSPPTAPDFPERENRPVPALCRFCRSPE
ncbi:MAG: hypothetical protein EBU57_01830 [Alphaproteobacteria bacterium]|nr:hypothetical protein [Alphaproteobacteria bacterium]